MRITYKKRSVVLIAVSEEWDALLSALRLRVAPYPIPRRPMEAEMRTASATSDYAPSLAPAAHDLVSDAADRRSGSVFKFGRGGSGGSGGSGVGTAVNVALLLSWVSTFEQGLVGVASTAEEVGMLAMPLGGLPAVGYALSVVAQSARAVGLVALEREGRRRLSGARDDLREASVLLVSWLFGIPGSGFSDGDGLVGKVLEAWSRRTCARARRSLRGWRASRRCRDRARTWAAATRTFTIPASSRCAVGARS